MKLILHWIVISAAVLATTYLVSNVKVNPIWAALIIGACLALVNMFVKPVINILTLPLNVVTLGLFSLVINGLIFWYLGSGIIRGFSVVGFQAAFVGAIVVSVINWILVKIFHLDW